MPASPEDVPTDLADVTGIFKLINDAVTEAGSSAASAATDAEEARRNARAASEVVRRYTGAGGAGGGENPIPSASDSIHARLSARSGGAISTGFSPRRAFGISPRSPAFSTMNGSGGNSSRSSTPHSAGSTGFFRSSRRKPPPSLNGGSGVSTTSHPQVSRPNTEELVALTLELERTKQALEAEQMRHDETKSALQRAAAKATQLEGQMGRVLNDMENQRETLGRRVDLLEHELAHARMRLEAAEEDADLAFDIAKENDRRREEAERLLPIAQQEVEELKAQVAVLSRTRAAPKARPQPPPPPPPPLPPPTSVPITATQSQTEVEVADVNKRASPKVVRFADNDPSQYFDAQSAMTASTSSTNQAQVSSSPSSSSRMDRSLVASGREVLRQFASGVNVSELSIDVLAERRKRLHDRMKSLDGQMNGSPSQHSFSTSSSIPSFSPMASPLRDIEAFLAASAESGQREAMIRGAVALLKASGRRLGLSGRWWNEAQAVEAASTPRKGTPESGVSFSTSASGVNNAVALETLTRHYCTSVEVLIDRKQKEIVELESLCALWEQQEHDKDNGNSRTR